MKGHTTKQLLGYTRVHTANVNLKLLHHPAINGFFGGRTSEPLSASSAQPQSLLCIIVDWGLGHQQEKCKSKTNALLDFLMELLAKYTDIHGATPSQPLQYHQHRILFRSYVLKIKNICYFKDLPAIFCLYHRIYHPTIFCRSSSRTRCLPCRLTFPMCA